jgi:hypothetical protein
MEGRDIVIGGRDIETEKQRDIADNKNPKQSWVVQLVYISIKDFVQAKKSATEKRKSNRNFLIFINEIEHQTS